MKSNEALKEFWKEIPIWAKIAMVVPWICISFFMIMASSGCSRFSWYAHDNPIEEKVEDLLLDYFDWDVDFTGSSPEAS